MLSPCTESHQLLLRFTDKPVLQAVQPCHTRLARCPANSNRGRKSAEGNCLMCRESHRD